MSKRKYFDIEGKDLPSSLSSVTGFYPITNKGLWHSGIHIIGNDSTLIKNPINGTIITYDTGIDKDEGYFVTKNTVTIPTSKKENKCITYYSVISHLKSLSCYSKIIDYKKDLFRKITHEEKTLLEKGLPFGIIAKIDTSTTSCPYIKLNELNLRKYENSDLYVNLLRNEVGNIRGFKTQTITDIPYCDKTETNVLFKPVSIRIGSKEIVQLNQGASIKISNNTYEISGKAITLNDEIKKEIGYLYVDGLDYKINQSGNISVYKLPREKQVYYKVVDNNKTTDDAFLLNISQKINIQSVLLKIEEILENREIQKTRSSEYVRYMHNGSEITFYSGNASDLFSRKQFLSELIRLFDIRDKIVIINVEASSIFPRSGFSETILKMIQSEKAVFINANPTIALPDYDYFVQDEKDEYLVIKITCFEGLLRDSIIPLMDSVGIKTKRPDKLKKVVKTQLPNPVNALKIQIKGKDIYGSAYLGKTGYFECRPYLISGKDYTFPLDDATRKKIFTRCRISTLIGYSDVEFEDNSSFLYSLKAQRNTVEDAYSSYNAEPIDIIQGDYEVTNFPEILEQMKEISTNSDSSDTSNIWCKLDRGYVSIPRDKITVSIEFLPKDELIGKKMNAGTCLAFPATTESGSSFFDWSVFFIESFLNSKPDLCKINLPAGTECKKVEEKQKDLNKEIFFPIYSNITTTPINGIDTIKKLVSVTCSISLYKKARASGKQQITSNEKYCSSDLQRFFISSIPFTVNNKLLVDFFDDSDLENFKNNHTMVNFPSGDQFTIVKTFFDKLILSKVFDKVSKTSVRHDEHEAKFGVVYDFLIDISAKEICDAYGIQEPLCIESGVEKTVLGKGGIFKVFTIEKAYTNTTLQSEYINDKASFRSSDGSRYEISLSDGEYVFDKSVYEKYMVNNLQNFINGVITLNFPDANGKMKLDTAMCPVDKLVCDVGVIKPKLQEIKELQDCIQGADSNYLFKEDGYLTGLAGYLYKTMSKHPLEQSKAAQDAITDGDRSRLNILPFSEKMNDIFNDLNIADSNTFKENSFYFMYPPSFFDTLDECGLFEINPYLSDKPMTMRTSDQGYGVGEWKTTTVVDSPGFAPLVSSPKDYESNGQYYAPISGLFNQDYSKLAYYASQGMDMIHEGLDFGAAEGSAINSLIYGQVLACGWLNSGYGYIMIVKETGKNKLYFLAHLQPESQMVKEGEYVVPGQPVARVGGSGRNKNPAAWDPGFHLHLEVWESPFSEKKYIIKDELLAGGYLDFTPRFSAGERSVMRRDPFKHDDVYTP